MATPLITIAVPSLNQGKFLGDALASIFAQELPIEVFVLDGGSDDNSLDIINQWKPRLAGWRSHKDTGQAAAINEGISSGSAPYVCWLNSDDIYYPDGLSRLLNKLRKNADSAFIYGSCWTISASSKKISPYLSLPFSPRLFANFCTIAQPATLITRRAWEMLGGLEENMDLAFDYDLWWRLYNETGKPAHCRAFVAGTRMHGGTKTANNTTSHYRESMAVVKKHWGSIPLKWKLTLPIIKMIRNMSADQD